MKFVFVLGCLLLAAVASGRQGVLCTFHGPRAWIEIDCGALNIAWVPQGASSAFAETRIERLTHDWCAAGWTPRISITPSCRFFGVPLWMLGGAGLLWMMIVPRLGRRE